MYILDNDDIFYTYAIPNYFIIFYYIILLFITNKKILTSKYNTYHTRYDLN